MNFVGKLSKHTTIIALNLPKQTLTLIFRIDIDIGPENISIPERR